MPLGEGDACVREAPTSRADQRRRVLVEKGLFQALQMCVQRLGGAAAKSEHVPILRKVVKIVLGLMENAPSLVVKKLRDTRTARGTLAAALADLRRSADAGLREVAQRVAARLPPPARNKREPMRPLAPTTSPFRPQTAIA